MDSLNGRALYAMIEGETAVPQVNMSKALVMSRDEADKRLFGNNSEFSSTQSGQ